MQHNLESGEGWCSFTCPPSMITQSVGIVEKACKHSIAHRRFSALVAAKVDDVSIICVYSYVSMKPAGMRCQPHYLEETLERCAESDRKQHGSSEPVAPGSTPSDTARMLLVADGLRTHLLPLGLARYLPATISQPIVAGQDQKLGCPPWPLVGVRRAVCGVRRAVCGIFVCVCVCVCVCV